MTTAHLVRARIARALTAALVVASLTVTGCGVLGGETEPPAAQDSRPLAVLGDQADEFSAVLATARWIRTRECMIQRGFTFPDPPQGSDLPLPDQPLGVNDLEQARQYGYHAPPRPNIQDAVLETLDALDPSERHAFDVAYMGTTPGEPTRVDIPGGNDPEVSVGEAGSCLLQARNEVEGDALRYTALRMAIEDLANEAAADALADDRVVAALDRWKSCMSNRGFQVDDPLQAAGPYLEAAGQESGPSQQEIEQAVADVECKTESDLVDTYKGVRNGYEQRAVEDNVELLAEWRDVLDATLSRASDVVAG